MRFFSIVGTVALVYIINPMAQASPQCLGGLIQEQTVDGDLIVAGGECTIISSTIEGDVHIRDSDYVLLVNNEISGRVQITRSDGNEGAGVAHVIANTVVGGNFTVRDYDEVNVIDNHTLMGSIRVNGNRKALVQKNIAAYNLFCKENENLSSFVNFAREQLRCE